MIYPFFATNVYKGKWKVTELRHISLEFRTAFALYHPFKSRCSITVSNYVKLCQTRDLVSNACKLSAQKTFQLQFLRDSAKAARLCQMVPCMNLINSNHYLICSGQIEANSIA